MMKAVITCGTEPTREGHTTVRSKCEEQGWRGDITQRQRAREGIFTCGTKLSSCDGVSLV